MTESTVANNLCQMRQIPPRHLIRIAAAVVVNDHGETLLVRKHGTTAFMQPGGKIAPGESNLEALARELHEELGAVVDPASSRYLGRFRALAANEPGGVVDADIFSVELSVWPCPAAEIAELTWLHPDAADRLELAPLSKHHVLPLVRHAEWPRQAPRALFICKGNWFRSQMAAALYNRLTQSIRGESAGTYAGAPDEPEGQILTDLFPTSDFFEVMEEECMYVRANATRQLRPEMLEQYDLVVTMAEEPFIPDFLRSQPKVIQWEVENPSAVDEAKAREILAQMRGLVGGLITGLTGTAI